jgi:hypothetical protein
MGAAEQVQNSGQAERVGVVPLGRPFQAPRSLASKGNSRGPDSRAQKVVQLIAEQKYSEKIIANEYE